MSKRKVINVSYRKDSKSFPDWMKYEIEILNEDGSTDTIPAYGRDLQDALSRVEHDKKVEKVSKVIRKVPDVIWVLLWFSFVGMLTMYVMSNIEMFGTWAGSVFIGGLMVISGVTMSIHNWFTLRNRNRTDE
jgi:hypothetical protein